VSLALDRRWAGRIDHGWPRFFQLSAARASGASRKTAMPERTGPNDFNKFVVA
jgi:hypothetical protein